MYYYTFTDYSQSLSRGAHVIHVSFVATSALWLNVFAVAPRSARKHKILSLATGVFRVT